MTAVMRTPKAVMLDAMLRFERIGLSLLAEAERLAETKASASQIALLATEGHKFMIAAVQCAEKVAPYCVRGCSRSKSRGRHDRDKAPYVIRAPMVMDDSTTWQAAVERREAKQWHPRRRAEPRQRLCRTLCLRDRSERAGSTTIMPARPVVVKPTGTQEWLESVASQRKR